MILIICVTILLIIAAIAIAIGMLLSQMTFFCAYPRTSAYGDVNQLTFIRLKGFFFIISNDLFGNDVVFSQEASNLMFQYNLRPTINEADILNNNKDLNIEILDITTNKTMSYRVLKSNKPLAVKFFKKYRELMQMINNSKTK